MSEKKTITLANGEAEEGDRVSNLRDWISGNLVYRYESLILMDDNAKEHDISHEEEKTEEGIMFSGDMLIQFGPTDALEAVEEELNEWSEGLEKNYRTDVDDRSFKAVMKALRGVGERINQKRKGG